MKNYIQEKNLKQFFDLSPDYFKKRKGKELLEGKHFIVPPTTSSTKKVILWDLKELEAWIRSKIPENDDEVATLLSRKG